MESVTVQIGDAEIAFTGAVFSGIRNPKWSEDSEGNPIAAISGLVEIIWAVDLKCDPSPDRIPVTCWCWEESDDDGQWDVSVEGAKAIAAAIGFLFTSFELPPIGFIRAAFGSQCRELGLAICQAIRELVSQEAP